MANIVKYNEAATTEVITALDNAMNTIKDNIVPELEEAKTGEGSLSIGSVSSIASAISVAETTMSRLDSFKKKVKKYAERTQQFDWDAANLLNGILDGAYDGYTFDDKGNLIVPGAWSPSRPKMSSQEWEQALYASYLYALIKNQEGENKPPTAYVDLILSFIMQGKNSLTGPLPGNEIKYVDGGNHPDVGFFCTTLGTYVIKQALGIPLNTGPKTLLQSDNILYTAAIADIGYQNVPWGSFLSRTPTYTLKNGLEITTKNANGSEIQGHTTNYLGTYPILYQGNSLSRKNDDVLYIGPAIGNATGPKEDLQALPLPHPGYYDESSPYTTTSWVKGVSLPSEPYMPDKVYIVQGPPPKGLEQYLYPINVNDADFLDDNGSKYEQHIKDLAKPIIEKDFYEQQNRIPGEYLVLTD